MILLKNINDIELAGNELKNYRRKKKILNLLYNYEALSATSISKEIGVSLPTVISILKDLSQNNFVEARGTGQSRGGRKPMMFGLKNNSTLIIACELGRFEGKIGVYNSHNKLVARIQTFNAEIDDKDLVDKIYRVSQTILENEGLQEDCIFGVGVAMPGLIDEIQGINYTIKDKEYQNIKERLKERFRCLVYVNNDARMQAYGEFIFGKAAGYSNAMVINWNWGLGLGLILDNKLYNGADGFAGELSHIKFEEDGDLCICGKRGCLETITSVYVLIAKAKQAVKEKRVSQLTKKFKNNIEKLRVEDIILAARKGDEFSIELLNSVGLALGKVLSNAIQLLNPGVIVLGGIVSEAKQFVLTPIQQSINQHCLEKISGNIKIEISEKWKESGLLGITAMLYQKLFSNMYM